MATGVGIALPEPRGNDARSWLKRFEVCAAANKWNDEKKLLRLPTLLKGRALAIFDALSGTYTDTYEHLKKVHLDRLSPDTDEDRFSIVLAQLCPLHRLHPVSARGSRHSCTLWLCLLKTDRDNEIALLV